MQLCTTTAERTRTTTTATIATIEKHDDIPSYSMGWKHENCSFHQMDEGRYSTVDGSKFSKKCRSE